ncbi:winged helix-turn-helix domain-containing protein [Asanoa sp. NPDC049518]|uniref:winged helix-turn-helix domain-containing protein n=1 Tax=unclassified Asanoa TaxID=2685164 RepID=UPI003449D1DE
MAIRIPTDVATLARSRFATSPASEVMATLRGRRSATLPTHARRWHSRALARLDAWTVDLLHALVPADHPYVPDFLTPNPRQPRETRDRTVEAIAATPPDDVARELDFGLAGRPVHREFAESFGDEQRYLRWRRPAPGVLADLIGAGEAALAREAADAFGRFFDAAIAEDWPRVTAVLDADVAHRSEVMAERGLAAMIGTLGTELDWDGHELTLRRPYDVMVDWADDGVLLTPCTALAGSVVLAAERPRTPQLTYPARGTAALHSDPGDVDRATHLGELISATRLRILRRLDEPHTTQALSELDGRATATISYHLGVLHRGGLVTSRRSGRGVLYRRTALGDALLTGELPDAR